jgi:hypothetical protein
MHEESLLPLELLQIQLSTIDLLLAMFYLDGEILQINPEATDSLRSWLEGPTGSPPDFPPYLGLDLRVQVDTTDHLELNVQFPLYGSKTLIEEHQPPLPKYTLRCPPWLNRKANAELAESMPVDDPDGVLAVVEYLKAAAPAYLKAQSSANASKTSAVASSPGQLVRVWFYLQSLSTRSKRDDMVNWAPSYGLTGFVLAGKPGILCLEGTSENISDYMAEVKTRSWADVPSYQKKVSERYREEGDEVKRVFDNMREVTSEIGKGGHRGNRSEMSEVRRMFDSVGLGELFAEVLGMS